MPSNLLILRSSCNDNNLSDSHSPPLFSVYSCFLRSTSIFFLFSDNGMGGIQHNSLNGCSSGSGSAGGGFSRGLWGVGALVGAWDGRGL